MEANKDEVKRRQVMEELVTSFVAMKSVSS